MKKVIDGIKVSNILYEQLNKYLEKHHPPRVVDILIGEDLAGKIYLERKAQVITSKTKIQVICKHFKKITYEKLIDYIKKLNKDNSITGIMIQLPLPDNLKNCERKILDTIDPKKDIDGLTTTSINNLKKDKDTLIPCTALGIEMILKAYKINLENKKVAIINRSNIVGKPLEQLMYKNKAIPIICHSQTKNLKEKTKECDIVIVALNKQEFITSDYIKKGAIIIDVGVHKDKNGKIVGDVDFDDVYKKVSLITPATKAVGTMTICMFAYNATKAVYGKRVKKMLEKSIKNIME